MSKLPKINQPLFEITIPSNKKKYFFRPYVVTEEKILLLAKQSEDDTEILRAVKQIITNTIQNIDFDTSSLTTFDMEYIFLKLRAKSVNNMVELSYRDKEDDTSRPFQVNLDEIEVEFNEKNNPKITISEDLTMLMRYPLANITDRVEKFKNEVELLLFFVSNCIETIYDKEEVFLMDDYTSEEKEEFVNSLPVKTLEEIKVFFDTLPRLYHKLEYTNSKGTERKIELSNLKDFFILG